MGWGWCLKGARLGCAWVGDGALRVPGSVAHGAWVGDGASQQCQLGTFGGGWVAHIITGVHIATMPAEPPRSSPILMPTQPHGLVGVL